MYADNASRLLSPPVVLIVEVVGAPPIMGPIDYIVWVETRVVGVLACERHCRRSGRRVKDPQRVVVMQQPSVLTHPRRLGSIYRRLPFLLFLSSSGRPLPLGMASGPQLG